MSSSLTTLDTVNCTYLKFGDQQMCTRYSSSILPVDIDYGNRNGREWEYQRSFPPTVSVSAFHTGLKDLPEQPTRVCDDEMDAMLMTKLSNPHLLLQTRVRQNHHLPHIGSNVSLFAA